MVKLRISWKSGSPKKKISKIGCSKFPWSSASFSFSMDSNRANHEHIAQIFKKVGVKFYYNFLFIKVHKRSFVLFAVNLLSQIFKSCFVSK